MKYKYFYIFLGLSLFNIFQLTDLLAQSAVRRAQCLLEIKGVHYIGGQCVFIPLDRAGSFRVADVQGINLVAQINVTGKDQGILNWNGPLGGNSPAVQLGSATRSEACWSLEDGDANTSDSLICAWSLNDSVYTGPTPKVPDPKTVIYYGSKIGSYDDIVSKQGIDTSRAMIQSKTSFEGAVIYCRDYDRDYSLKCIKDVSKPVQSTLIANCPDRRFKSFGAEEYVFLGKNKDTNSEIFSDYIIKNIKTNEILDGSTASGFEIQLGVFEALCPSFIK